MIQQYVGFPSGNITLEGAWHLPDKESKFPVVVVCHPHPLYGGEMNNNVVIAVCHELCRQGIAAFRFNFRGAGSSQGSYNGGICEQEDIKAALSFVSKDNNVDSSRMGLVGYSFGAGVSLSVSPSIDTIKAIALISPPLEMPQWEEFSTYKIPKLIVGGSEDAFFPSDNLILRARDITDPKEYEIIEGPDHFWGGFETQLADRVASFFIRHL